jgi:tRNA(fMet)-specific endonuclease VapC
MDYLPDTDTCIFCQRERPVAVRKKLEEVGFDRVWLSAVTAYELRYGVKRHPNPIKARANVRAFLMPFTIPPWTDACATEAAKVRRQLEKAGEVTGAYDIQIAAHARTLGLTVVTYNVAEFTRVSGLTAQNWCPAV